MERGAIIAGQTTSEAAFSIFMSALSLGITAAFVYYLFTQPERLAELWAWTRSMNILVQGLVWLLFLPWMICLWFWIMPWALPIRIVLVAAGLLWTNWLLWPWK